MLQTEQLSSIPYEPRCLVCGAHAEQRCAKCRTYYCCRDHQAADWQDVHSHMCSRKSMIVEGRSSSGRIAMASRPFYAGDIICMGLHAAFLNIPLTSKMTEEPLVTLSEDFSHPIMVRAHQAAMSHLKALGPDAFKGDPQVPEQSLLKLLRPAVLYMLPGTSDGLRRFLRALRERSLTSWVGSWLCRSGVGQE